MYRVVSRGQSQSQVLHSTDNKVKGGGDDCYCFLEKSAESTVNLNPADSNKTVWSGSNFCDAPDGRLRTITTNKLYEN